MREMELFSKCGYIDRNCCGDGRLCSGVVIYLLLIIYAFYEMGYCLFCKVVYLL